MDELAIERYLLNTFADVQVAENYGYKFFFYGEDHRLPFATMASSDNEYDRVSNLDRPGVFRLNIGVKKETFRALFGAAEISVSNYDFTQLNRFMPHPDYAKQFFLCILSPQDSNLTTLLEFLNEAHAIAERRYLKAASREA
jgi:hypothetical protein